MTADSQRSSVSAGSSVSTTSAQRRMVRYILPANAMIGPYRIEKALGRGGMGEVYLALHTKLNVLRAIKILPARFCAADKNYGERFLQEARRKSACHRHGLAGRIVANAIEPTQFTGRASIVQKGSGCA